MKNTRLIVLFASLAAIFFLGTTLVFLYLWNQTPQIVATFDSPDGHWRLTITDIDPSIWQETLVYNIEEIGGHFPLSGTQYVNYWDEGSPSSTVTWSEDHVRIEYSYLVLIGEFERGKQAWHTEEEQGEDVADADTDESAN